MAKELPFHVLQRNLHEIRFHLARSDWSLIADPFSRRIYGTKTFLGRVCSWFYRFVAVVNPIKRGLREKNYQEAFTRTQHAYWKAIEALQKDLDCYEYTMKVLYEEKNIARREWFRRGNRIVKYKTTLFPVWRFCKNHPSQRADAFAKQFFIPKQSWGVYLRPLDETLGVRAASAIYVARLSNELSKVPILAIFRSFAQKKTCLTLPERQKAWIRQLSKHRSPSWVHVVHRAFLCFARVLLPEEKPHEAVGKWSLFFHDAKCSFVTRPDPEQVAWRDQIYQSEGDPAELEMGGRVWKVGPPLEEGGEEIDHRRCETHESAGNSAETIVFPDNPFYCHMMPLLTKKPWGVRPVDLLAVDPAGRFYVQERLRDALMDQPWNITEIKNEKTQQHFRALAIANWIAFYWAKKKTPLHIDPKQLFFDQRGILKSMGAMEPGETFDIALVEQLLQKISGNRYELFSFGCMSQGLRNMN